jgi:MFS family permease
MADMYGEKDRGKSLAIVTLLPYLGPALGPIVGGLATQLVHWSWIFWIMSIFNAVIIVFGFFCIRETYTPVLFRRKALAEGVLFRIRKLSVRVSCESSSVHYRSLFGDPPSGLSR